MTVNAKLNEIVEIVQKTRDHEKKKIVKDLEEIAKQQLSVPLNRYIKKLRKELDETK